ncbi:MAG: type II toxin-antitoxin system VapC family toxin [Nostoc sp.]|uniref:type II toxin-antitoxin system VapC family toxin n=1 Tax=Nostoc sp. TaxID=1180 RepID=UPI002FF5AB19
MSGQSHMTNSTIVDTDILIDAGRGVLEAVKCLQNLKASSGIAISIITQIELMVGCANKAELQTLENFLNQFYIIKIDHAVSDIAVNLLRSYRLSHGLVIPDSLIAATAIVSGKLPVYHKKPT